MNSRTPAKIARIRACELEVGWWYIDYSLGAMTKVETVEKIHGRSVIVSSVSEKGTHLRSHYRWNEELGHATNAKAEK